MDTTGTGPMPWRWRLVIVPVALIMLRRGSADARTWALATLVGGACLAPFALISETRAFGDLIGFASLTVVYFLQRRRWIAD